MKKWIWAVVALVSSCKVPPEPPHAPAGHVIVNERSFKVQSLTTFDQRTAGLVGYGAMQDCDALLFCHARERYQHYWYTGGFVHEYEVAFLDAAGLVTELTSLVASEEGITSKKEVKYALFVKKDELTRAGAKEGMRIRLADDVAGARIEENPVFEVDGKRIFVEFAVNDDERARGLMHRPRMSKDDGMLFVYSFARERRFWMANTLIPLSLAYMSPEGKIFKIHDMEPYADPHDLNNEKRWPSGAPARYALEVNIGRFRELGISEGAAVKLPPELQRYPPQ